MITFGDRIRALADALGKEEQQIAADLGLTKSRLSHYINGRSKVPSELLQKLVDIYKINPQFLFREDAPLYEGGEQVAESRVSYRLSNEYTYFPTAISAGLPLTVDGITESSTIVVSEEVLGKYKNDKGIFFARINGDSMNNLMEDNSLIAIKPVPLELLKNGDIVVYSNEHEYSVKHYHKYGDTLVFKPNSKNTEHKEQEYSVDDDVRIHGKVVTYIVNVD